RSNLEKRRIAVQVGAEVGIGTTAVRLPKRGKFAEIAVSESTCATLKMEEFGLAAVNASVAGVAQAIAIIRIVAGHGEAILIESSDAQEEFTGREHAGPCDRQAISCDTCEGHVAVIRGRQVPEGVICVSVVKSLHDPGMLKAPVRVQQ